MPEGKKSVSEMCAEFLREVAVLVLVFYPLERKEASRWDMFLILAVSAFCLILGVAWERWRKA